MQNLTFCKLVICLASLKYIKRIVEDKLQSKLTVEKVHILILVAGPEVHNGNNAGVSVEVDKEAEAGSNLFWNSWKLEGHFSIFLDKSVRRLVIQKLVTNKAKGSFWEEKGQ